MKILMVCLGNICRSPLAEGILKEKVKKAGLNWLVESAGTNRFHTGQAPHPLSQKIARLHGIDISQQRARTFVPQDMDKYDRIYALANDVLTDIKRMSGSHFNEIKTGLLLNEMNPGEDQDVPDPYYGGESGYHEVFELIDKACTAILNKYSVTLM